MFGDYYKNRAGSNTIVKAYAAYNSFNYVIRKRKADPMTFNVIENAYRDKTGLPLLCYVAWLKDISDNTDRLKKSDINNMAQSILTEMCEKELVYDFYKKFKGFLNIPYNAYGVTVIEYYGMPDRKVELHYRGNDERTY